MALRGVSPHFVIFLRVNVQPGKIADGDGLHWRPDAVVAHLLLRHAAALQ